LLTTLKEQPQLYDLHTHLLGMGNAGFWVDTILMNPNIMPTNSTFDENESVRRNLCPLIWYEKNQDNQDKQFGFVDGDKAAAFFYYLIKESKLPKKTENEFNMVINQIQQQEQFQFSNLSSIDKLINDFKLNQELLHRDLCFEKHFSYDVVLKLDDLCKGLGIKRMDNHDLKQVAVAEKLGINSPQSSIKFRDWIIFNAREQKFEIVYGIRVEDLRQLMHIDPNAPNEVRRLVRAHIINAFSMCDAEGAPARHVDLQSFHGNFTPTFYPRRFALKDSIYHQRLDVLAALIVHIIERYQSCLPPIKYCEFSVSVNDLTRAWVFDVLRSFPVDEDVVLSTTQDDIVQAKKKFSSFSQMVCKKHFSYLRVAYKAHKNEENKFFCTYKFNYKFLAGFSREQIKSKHFKTQDEALRLLTDSPQVAVLEMAYEIMDSLKLKNEKLATRETFAPFVDKLLTLKKDIKKRPSFYKWVVGLDLFADELGYPYCPFVARPFIQYVKRQRKKYNKRFGLRIHGGENVIFANDNSAAYRLFVAHMYIVFISLRFLQRELKYGIRIGHGIAFEHILGKRMSGSRYRKSSILMAEMEHQAESLFKKIAFEVNITSNEYLLGQTLRQGDFAHTLRLDALLGANIPIILATDDDGIWPIDQCSFVHPGHQSLAAEYCRAISSCLISENEHLSNFLESARNFCFWDPENNRRENTEQDTSNSSPDDDDDDIDRDPNSDHDDNIANTIIIHPDIIKRILKRYDNSNLKQTNFKDRWQQLLKGEQSDVEWQNDVMQHVAFICVCENSEKDVAKRDFIYEEYKELFHPHDYFNFIYENWTKIRDEFMLGGDGNVPSLSQRVFIEKSPLWVPTNNRNIEVKIHAFGPNMINNENVEELERFKKSYPKYTENMSLVIYTNNDKNTYHYHKTSESLKIAVNPNPSQRETQKQNFLYALCEHASAATAALHCISEHIRRHMASAEPHTNDDDHNVLDVFDSDMTSQTLLHYGFRNESTINSKLKDLLHNILDDLSKLQRSNPEKPTEAELIVALGDHRRVRFIFH
jgi:hypothetical protein